MAEAFLHCAKSVIRSHLWDTPPAGTAEAPENARPGLDGEAAAFLARSPFIAVSAVDGDGLADVSPKGDPAGFVRLLDDGRLVIPNRPGNRRTDTMHNLLTRSSFGILAFVPGVDWVLEIAGTGHNSADPALLEPIAVGGKVPTAAIVVEPRSIELRPDPGINAAGLWKPAAHVDSAGLPRATKVWTDHVKQNGDPGLKAAAMRKLINERMMRAESIATTRRTSIDPAMNG